MVIIQPGPTTAERPPKCTSQVHGNLTSSPLSCESAAFFEFLAFRCTYLFSSALFLSTPPLFLCEYFFSVSFSLSLSSFALRKEKKKTIPCRFYSIRFNLGFAYANKKLTSCDRITLDSSPAIMSETKEFTLKEIEAHNTKKDLYMVIHDKVYDCSSFVDEHPYVSAL